jgi:hypothetical protein
LPAPFGQARRPPRSRVHAIEDDEHRSADDAAGVQATRPSVDVPSRTGRDCCWPWLVRRPHDRLPAESASWTMMPVRGSRAGLAVPDDGRPGRHPMTDLGIRTTTTDAIPRRTHAFEWWYFDGRFTDGHTFAARSGGLAAVHIASTPRPDGSWTSAWTIRRSLSASNDR